MLAVLWTESEAERERFFLLSLLMFSDTYISLLQVTGVMLQMSDK